MINLRTAKKMNIFSSKTKKMRNRNLNRHTRRGFSKKYFAELRTISSQEFNASK